MALANAVSIGIPWENKAIRDLDCIHSKSLGAVHCTMGFIELMLMVKCRLVHLNTAYRTRCKPMHPRELILLKTIYLQLSMHFAVFNIVA